MHAGLCEAARDGEPHGDCIGRHESQISVTENLRSGIQKLVILVVSEGELQGIRHSLRHLAREALEEACLK